MLINYNGQLIDADKPIFTAANRSFRYGDGFFESIRLQDNISPLFEYHLNRIAENLKTLKMKDPAGLKDLGKYLSETAEANGNSNGRARIIIFRKEGGMYEPESNSSEFVIETFDQEGPLYFLNEKGLTIDFFREQNKATGPLSNIKTTSSLLYVQAALFTSENKLDDCLLLNEHGNIVETGRSNIFFIKNGIIYTPALSEGCVSGVMRTFLINFLGKPESPVVQASISEEFMHGCQEMFSSSAVHGIKWVERCGKHCFTNSISIVLQRKIIERLT